MHKYFMLLEVNLQDKFMEVSLLDQNINMYLIVLFIDKFVYKMLHQFVFPSACFPAA